MPSSDIRPILSRPELMASEINTRVPLRPGAEDFRADLAGLLVVSMAASYEECVKEILVNFAANCHSRFAYFAKNQFAKINSKVEIDDLYKYAKLFDASIHKNFKESVGRKKSSILHKTGEDITLAYKNILAWRHAYAHTGARVTTVEEAIKMHTLAKRVLFAFNESFT